VALWPGRRLRVWWPAELAWFPAHIAARERVAARGSARNGSEVALDKFTLVEAICIILRSVPGRKPVSFETLEQRVLKRGLLMLEGGKKAGVRMTVRMYPYIFKIDGDFVCLQPGKEAPNRVHLIYDDGDEEETLLSRRKFEWVDDDASGVVPGTKGEAGRATPGRRLAVYWTEMARWYCGEVEAVLDGGYVRIKYDDGDADTVRLESAAGYFVWLDRAPYLAGGTGSPAALAPRAAKSKQKSEVAVAAAAAAKATTPATPSAAAGAAAAAAAARTEGSAAAAAADDPAIPPAPAGVSLNATKERVRLGTRVGVYWPSEREWFTGMVRKVKPGNLVHVFYDDGDRRVHKFRNERVVILKDQKAFLAPEKDRGEAQPKGIKRNAGEVSKGSGEARPPKAAKGGRGGGPSGGGGGEAQKVSRTKEPSAAWEGRRIELYWDDMGQWYRGTVGKCLPDPNGGPPMHVITYEDGDVEKLVLSREKYRFLKGRPPANGGSGTAQAKDIEASAAHAAGPAAQLPATALNAAELLGMEPLEGIRANPSRSSSGGTESGAGAESLSSDAAAGEELVCRLLMPEPDKGKAWHRSLANLPPEHAALGDFFTRVFGRVIVDNVDVLESILLGRATQVYDFRNTAVFALFRRPLASALFARRTAQLRLVSALTLRISAAPPGITQTPIYVAEVSYSATAPEEQRRGRLTTLIRRLEELLERQLGATLLVVHSSKAPIASIWRSPSLGFKPPKAGMETRLCDRLFCQRGGILLCKRIGSLIAAANAPTHLFVAADRENMEHACFGTNAVAAAGASRSEWEINARGMDAARDVDFTYIRCCVGNGTGYDAPHHIPYPLQVFRTPDRGHGVRAVGPIPANTLLVEYVGELVTRKEATLREQLLSGSSLKHFQWDLDYDGAGGALLDASRVGNIARFINHSCEPNCQSRLVMRPHPGAPIRVFISTMRDISAGEELAYDYNGVSEDGQPSARRSVQCFCGAPSCKGFVFQ